MRCIYLNHMSKEEKNNRKDFLQKVFHLFFIQIQESKYVEFTSLPSNVNDSLLVYGHNGRVSSFFMENKPIEQIILVIACKYGLNFPNYMKNKTVYISKTDKDDTNLYNGKMYGFSFDITDTEILLYRFKEENFNEQISNSFERMVL